MSQFEWTSFYMEFADALLEYKDRRGELIEKMKRVHEAAGLKYPTVDRNNAVNDIDPFTVFGMFNKGIKQSSRIALLSRIAEEFHVSASVPQSFNGIPVLNNQMAAFFWFDSARGIQDIHNLWLVFEAALCLAQSDTANNRNRFISYYDIVLSQKGVRWNLTMGLFWVRPYFFVNLDSTNRSFLLSSEGATSALVPSFKRLLHKLPNGSTYLKIRDLLFSAFSDEAYPYKSFPSFSSAAWQSDAVSPVESSDWFPRDYTPGFSVEDWKELLADSELFPPHCLQIMKRMLDIGGQATCTELAEKYGETWNFYNSGSSGICQRIYKKTNCPIMSRDEGGTRWWAILYLGKDQERGKQGSFIWRLRDELRTALEQTDLSHVPLYADALSSVETNPVGEVLDASRSEEAFSVYTKQTFLSEVYLSSAQYDQLHALLKRRKNIILQGAPGVGKTYAAKRLAYAFMGEKDDSRIEMIQFHQSYSYEDFVMGYRPAGTGFALQKGIFYEFCEQARACPDKDFFFIIDEINRGNLSKIFGELLMLIEAGHRNESVRLSCDPEHPFSVPDNVYLIGMMNTADRSLALIDYALRRRFGFFEMLPAFDNEQFAKRLEEADNENLRRVIKVILRLNKAIEEDGTLGRGFCIGHSHFCDWNECGNECLNSVIEYDILPTLREYWFDDEASYSKWADELRGALQ